MMNMRDGLRRGEMASDGDSVDYENEMCNNITTNYGYMLFV